MGGDADGIWFRSASPLVFQMQPINTLEELKSVILRNMGAFKFKIFWVEGDAHVRAMFELHRRYGTREVMELLIEMQAVHDDGGGFASSSRGGPGAIVAPPIHFATP
ncbi:hypothetical protein PIB30_064918 [Stylosanthes scabra]|uniref:Uncharacterized protein n=1 Tax=Stylosanthes scabra TaxID=79078 RepID=A0ABU6UPV2_9FABA|nr:hypothetical protein [Stylosanthes scabra]